MDEALIAELASRFEGAAYARGIVLPAGHLIPALAALRDDHGYKFLRDITSVDWLGKRRPRACGGGLPGSDKRLDLIYQLSNLSSAATISIKCFLDDGEKVPSAVPVFPTAEFLEREVFDLMGIRFQDHPDMRRILLSDDWEGHPLRKDYPVTGYEMWDWKAHR